jgi:hypothetical protein
MNWYRATRAWARSVTWNCGGRWCTLPWWQRSEVDIPWRGRTVFVGCYFAGIGPLQLHWYGK